MNAVFVPMNWQQEGWKALQEKHKVFVSYYHQDDQYYRDEFENRFGNLFISKSVESGDIDSDVSTEYVKRLIQEGYLDDASVMIVLVGPKTLCRKHVDWEISAALNKKVGGYSGLMGILLPEFPLKAEGKFQFRDVPPRLADNVKSGYAKIYAWSQLCSDSQGIKAAVQSAFDDRVAKADHIDNSRQQMQRNTCA